MFIRWCHPNNYLLWSSWNVFGIKISKKTFDSILEKASLLLPHRNAMQDYEQQRVCGYWLRATMRDAFSSLPCSWLWRQGLLSFLDRAHVREGRPACHEPHLWHEGRQSADIPLPEEHKVLQVWCIQGQLGLLRGFLDRRGAWQIKRSLFSIRSR